MANTDALEHIPCITGKHYFIFCFQGLLEGLCKLGSGLDLRVLVLISC